ncbi:DNA recombinase [Chryseobacterium formosense]|uniref:DNA recombinase n=1 Tax=Chryseobacterium formosense TaxID=236814 RepID=A0A085Z8H1_9FLAO|nr:AAA family ATPase [Chryseobacterium formosense]KFF00735.1 DNA recombinase [Chryseobacterium formosense]SFT37267.1 putative ATP-dependent endonuclease of the OLD family [Chryseobacterium formosense]
MYISKVIISNFKSYRKPFCLELEKGLNILVGNNETGKSTILEAIHLALSGLSNGRYFINDLSEYFFNYESVQKYLSSLGSSSPLPPPEISIEIFIAGDELPFFEGNGNSTRKNECGICFKIELAEKYRGEYNEYVAQGNISALPIEFYEVNWTSFARESITPRKIPVKSAMIDSTSNRYRNGSDVYISHILRNHLEEKDKNGLTQAHRRLQTQFVNDDSVKKVNDIISSLVIDVATEKRLKLTIDLSSRDAWESSFLTSVEEIPFHHIGKGEQAVIKTKLALEHKKSKEANILLIEEPENHLSHSKLNQLIKDIHNKCIDKQILISTHSSFVANKLGLEKLVIIENKIPLRLKNLKGDTQEFFEKLPGYDTLRLILCKKAILVEGDCDELLVQRAYMDKNRGRLPIEDEIDVISVGTSFLRFLQIASKIEKPVCVVTDSDGDVNALELKYAEYLGDNAKSFIKICYDDFIDSGELLLANKKPFNYNTLEPKFLKANGIQKLNKIFGSNKNEDELHLYMKTNKTSCALKIFETVEQLKFPKYILDAIEK